VFALQILGLTICGLVLASVGLFLVAACSRRVEENRRRRRSLELLLQQVQAARTSSKGRTPVALAWNGYRNFVMNAKVDEGGRICSFYLVPQDNRPLPSFLPGQYLTFQISLPGQPKPVIRCYSLSDAHNPSYYRVTIKKVPLTPDSSGGLPPSVSNYFHDVVREGDILSVKAPRGKFVLDTSQQTPVVLIGGGVGITPILCMANTLCAARSQREVWLFYGVRNGQEQIMKKHFRLLAKEYMRCQLRLCYSQPNPEDSPDHDFHFGTHVSVDLLRNILPSNDYEFYICGPPAMMDDMARDLRAWGVPEERIRSEAFGPATVKKAFVRTDAKEPTAAAAPASLQVTFSQSGKQCAWEPEAGNLLDFSLANSINIASGCRAGNCGTCEVRLKAGSVTYLHEPGWEVQAGHCLTCVAVPKEPVVLDV
jgi:ferredoxin-NADP reductase